MNHDEARDLLTDRLLDELHPGERGRLEAHLRSCPECGEAERQLAATWKALGALEPAPIDPATHVRFGRRLERDASPGRNTTGLRVPLLAAAAMALLITGGLAGRALAPVPAPGSERGAPPADGSQFMLLLRGEEPDRRQPADVLVAEYSAWAGTLAAAGSLVAAEELDPGAGRWVAPDTEPDPASSPVSGFFLVRAPSYDSAVAMARASPHTAYGGVIEVRRLMSGR